MVHSHVFDWVTKGEFLAYTYGTCTSLGYTSELFVGSLVGPRKALFTNLLREEFPFLSHQNEVRYWTVHTVCSTT